MEPTEGGRRMGHEFIGVVEAVGADVRTVKAGDLVVAPFAWSDGTCVFCREGLQTSCLHGGWWGGTEQDGGQGEAVRVPQADGTLVVLPGRRGRRADAVAADALRRDGDRPPRGARRAGRPGQDVAVVGDGAVGLCGVIAAKRLGAERIIILGRHRRPDRARPGLRRDRRRRASAATRRSSACKELTGGLGAHSVLECVGYEQSMLTALGIARPGGAVGRVGVPQHEHDPAGGDDVLRTTSRSAAAPRPARAYIEELLPDVHGGPDRAGPRLRPHGRRSTDVPDGYRAMDEREAIKVLIEP